MAAPGQKPGPRSKPGQRPKKVDPGYLERAALFYLERYASSTANLRRVLQRKVRRRAEGSEDGPPPEVAAWIEAVIEKLTRLGFLNDQRYAEQRTRRLYDEGKSLSRIRQTLAAKGVKADMTGAALENLAEERAEPVTDLPAAIAYARRRKLGPFRADPESRRELRNKDMAALARRGFSSDLIRRILAAESVEALESLSND
ncbi:regulatory protein RecX [Ferrovibrio sp.]|uniref:regulatory protein RecX n=1 Tax=Ferrovibrio sp. TaxID=1917215 RepID=UPI003D0D81C3